MQPPSPSMATRLIPLALTSALVIGSGCSRQTTSAMPGTPERIVVHADAEATSTGTTAPETPETGLRDDYIFDDDNSVTVDDDTPNAEPAIDDRRLTLPGWEDIAINEPAPAHSLRECKTTRLSSTSSITVCRACRDSSLAIPCIDMHVDGDIVLSVAARLPADDELADAVTSALHAEWGVPYLTHVNDVMDVTCWASARDDASLVANYYQLAQEHLRGGSAAKVPRLGSPIRVIMIRERDDMPCFVDE